jgi:REP element-mobilizing transposase RayT
MVRIERAGGLYHVLNRGNYRAAIFRDGATKEAFLRCLTEACEKTGWVVHAWCLMSNHYHLALETPQPNLVDGMQWFQATFATRFNRFRKEGGHLFQGRYKALAVERGLALGSLCHYLHLNPVRAGLCPVDQLADWRWSSHHWLMHPRLRPPWFTPAAALDDAGALADSPAGRRKYQEYLHWLSAEDLEQKRRGFERMSQGWALGTREFKLELLQAEQHQTGVLRSGEAESNEARELLWAAAVARHKAHLGAQATASPSKSADWKVAIATVLKAQTTVPNRWLAEHLAMGSLFTVSRLTTECRAGRRAGEAYHRLTATSKA